MNKKFKVTIPADELVEKINTFPIELYVLTENDIYKGLFTHKEMEEYITNFPTRGIKNSVWNLVQLTLNNLLYNKE